MEDTKPTTKRGPIRAILALLGPGLFLIGYNIGTGSVTTMAKSGADYGMELMWVVLLSCVFVFIGIVLFGRYTLATGETVLYAIKTHLPFGKPLSWLVMATVILGEFAGVAGMMALMVDILNEWIGNYCGLNFVFETKIMTITLPHVITLVISAILFLILWNGAYSFLESFLAVLVAAMGFCFVLTAIKLAPSIWDILSGLAFQIPEPKPKPGEMPPNTSMLIAGMAGTTFSVAMLYCRSITLKAKGWGPEKGRNAWIDGMVSAVSMFILSVAVMACAAGTLHLEGKSVKDTVDMVQALEPMPLVGDFAFTLFMIGIVGAGVSSFIPTILIAPWLISDYRGEKIHPKSTASRIFVIAGILFGMAGPFLNGKEIFGHEINLKPVELMIVSMALLAIIVPISMIVITVLLNQKRLGKYRNGWLLNVAAAAAIVFSAIMCCHGIVGVADEIEKVIHPKEEKAESAQLEPVSPDVQKNPVDPVHSV